MSQSTPQIDVDTPHQLQAFYPTFTLLLMQGFEMLTVEVFKTDVQLDDHAKLLVAGLSKLHPDCCINFDLDDCDKILRIEGEGIQPDDIEQFLSRNGFRCECLD